MRKMQEAARRIAHEIKEAKIPIDEEEYVASFKTEMMDAVHSWCKGATFATICKVRLLSASNDGRSSADGRPSQMTDIFEGSLIRCFRRLQELIRQMAMAAKAIGNTELEEKFTKSAEALERQSSVVFNVSER